MDIYQGSISEGMFDVGWVEAGFQILFALELDKNACATYERNFGGHILNTDITKFDLSLMPQAPVMFMGSPCKPFTNTNRQKKRLLDHDDNLLVRASIDAIKSNQGCKVFVYENVPPILTACNGQFRDEIYEELSEFEISSGILSAAAFGDPQARERAIFIGSKIGKIDLPDPILKPENYKTVREAFCGLSSKSPNQEDVSKAKDITMERIRSVPPGGNVHDIPESIRPSGVHSDMYKRLEWDKPSVTIVNPRKSMILHPTEDRIISVRECARLFGLPDSFEFVGGLSARQQQVANGVPRNLSLAIAKKIKEAIQRFNLSLGIAPRLQLV